MCKSHPGIELVTMRMKTESNFLFIFKTIEMVGEAAEQDSGGKVILNILPCLQNTLNVVQQIPTGTLTRFDRDKIRMFLYRKVSIESLILISLILCLKSKHISA